MSALRRLAGYRERNEQYKYQTHRRFTYIYTQQDDISHRYAAVPPPFPNSPNSYSLTDTHPARLAVLHSPQARMSITRPRLWKNGEEGSAVGCGSLPSTYRDVALRTRPKTVITEFGNGEVSGWTLWDAGVCSSHITVHGDVQD